MRFLLILVLLPVIEIYFFVKIGSDIGALSTVLFTILTGFLGIAAIKYQGVSSFMQARQSVMNTSQPGIEILSNLALFISGAFLLIPGVGAQGGSLKEVFENGANKQVGLLVNSSRGILYASSGEDYVAANAILINLVFLSAFILDAYAFSTEGIVGYSLGKKDLNLFKNIVKNSFILQIIILNDIYTQYRFQKKLIIYLMLSYQQNSQFLF